MLQAVKEKVLEDIIRLGKEANLKGFEQVCMSDHYRSIIP
jgi:hypothetical protein